MTNEHVAEQFKAYVAHKLPDATNIVIGFILPVFGGASRETFRIELNYSLNDEQVSRRVILRREFASGIVESQTRTEWEAYKAFYGTDVPVPELLWLEEDSKWLGSPFFVMEEIVDCQDSASLFQEPPYDAIREKIGERFCEIMGTIPKTDPVKVGLEGKVEKPAVDECWKKELDYWEALINKRELEPHPVLRAAIRRLRKNPPPPAQKVTIVHGDMRSGNFLFNEKGEIKAILDWELMHMGDPLEDLAWALNRMWSSLEPDLLGRMLPRERAIRVWEDTSGFMAEPEALFWWEVFSSIKGMAIWISMNNVYATGGNTDVIICYGGLWCADIQTRVLIKQMREGS